MLGTALGAVDISVQADHGKPWALAYVCHNLVALADHGHVLLYLKALGGRSFSSPHGPLQQPRTSFLTGGSTLCLTFWINFSPFPMRRTCHMALGVMEDTHFADVFTEAC